MGDHIEGMDGSPLSRVGEVEPAGQDVFDNEYNFAEEPAYGLVEPEVKSDLSEEAQCELRRVIETIKTNYPLQRIITSSGVHLRRGGNRHAVANCPFPIHSLRSPTLKIDLAAPDQFQCDSCGASGDVIDYVGALHGVVFLARQIEILTGKSLLSQLPSEYAFDIERVARVSRREEIDRTFAPDSVAASVYQALLDRLPLFDSHYDYLLQCGLSAQDCEVNGYRSLPPDIEARVAVAEDIEASGYSLKSVCGFFRISDDSPDKDRRGRWCIGGDYWGRRSVNDDAGPGADLYQAGGFLVPVRDRNGRVIRLVIENDPPPPSAPVSVKNVWPVASSFLTSAGREGGAGSGASGGARVHYAGKAGFDGGPTSALWLTERPLYADVLSSQLRTSVIGVLCYGQLVDEILREASRYKELYITIDNQNMCHVERICQEAVAKNIWASVAEWDFTKTRGFSNVRTGGGGLQWMASYESWLNENI
jgi:hypothetical protein